MAIMEGLEDLETDGKVGDWCFVENKGQTFMFLCYPISDEEWQKWHDFSKDVALELTRGDIVCLPVSAGEKKPVWQWDGNREAPTLSPSINVIGRWHGFLKAGKLVTA